MMIPILLVLLSAVLHSTWNVVLKQSGDKFSVQSAIQMSTAVIVLPIVLVAPPPRTVLANVIWGGLLHAVYNIALVRAYMLGEYSVVYPVARGVSPLVAALTAFVFLGEKLPAEGWAFVVIAVIGLVAIGGTSLSDAADRLALRWAFLTALVIASYTVVDTDGVRETGNALTYVSAIMLSNAVFLAPFYVLWRWKGAGKRISREDFRNVAVATPLVISAYGLVLYALRLAPVGYITSLREVGIVFGALIGWIWLGDSFGRRRIMASVLTVTGIIGITVTLTRF